MTKSEKKEYVRSLLTITFNLDLFDLPEVDPEILAMRLQNDLAHCEDGRHYFPTEMALKGLSEMLQGTIWLMLKDRGLDSPDTCEPRNIRAYLSAEDKLAVKVEMNARKTDKIWALTHRDVLCGVYRSWGDAHQAIEEEFYDEENSEAFRILEREIEL